MDKIENAKEILKESLIILTAAIILGLSVSFPFYSRILLSIIYFIIILLSNILTKKLVSYYFEADIKTKFWSWYQYGFKTGSHFKKSLPMLWLPLILSFISKGYFLWLSILEFEIKPRIERVTRRHGLYRFTEMTDWHLALIAAFGVTINLFLSIIGYISGFETFAKLNIYFAFWSLVPLSSLDGNKIFFGSRILWFTLLIIVSIFLGYSFIVV